MGRDATKAQGNVWRDARLEAAKYDERLYSREGVAEMIGVGIDAVRRIETNANKAMPVDTAVLLADLYNAPELLNYYCRHECPIGCNRPLSSEVVGIERVTVKLLKDLRLDELNTMKDKLVDIAADGVISEDELPALKEILDYLDQIAMTVSELKTLGQRAMKGKDG